jgi:hypothetical protein
MYARIDPLAYCNTSLPGDERVLLAEANEMRGSDRVSQPNRVRRVTVNRLSQVLVWVVLGLDVSRVTEYRLTSLVCWHVGRKFELSLWQPALRMHGLRQ